MQVILNRGEEPIEIPRLTVVVGEIKYIISTSIDGNLNINKSDSGHNGTDVMAVFPRYANSIEVK